MGGLQHGERRKPAKGRNLASACAADHHTGDL
jgi:hypothetical protein